MSATAPIIRIDLVTGERTTVTRQEALARLVVKPWHDLLSMSILLDSATEALPVEGDSALYWPATPPIRCADAFCPWSVYGCNPDADALLVAHAAEHAGGTRSNLQAARAARTSRSLRHAHNRGRGGVMAALCPYQPLEVMETANKVDGRVWFVRDAEESHIWLRVEYVDRRLMCWCDDGYAHAEAPDSEPPCAHLSAVVDLRMLTVTHGRSSVVNASAFVD